MTALPRVLAAALFLSSSLALAQVEVRLRVPTIRFEVEPVLVVVSPGVQVVEDYEEEVFFVERHYWVRHEGAWYRSRDRHGHWKHVEHRHVPRRLSGLSHGRYRHYRAAKHDHHEHHHERRHHEHHDGKHGKHGKKHRHEHARHHD